MSGDATVQGALSPGARLGEYIVAVEIASGGIGIVYLARREGERAGDGYAIKVVHDDLVRRFPEIGDLLRREAQIASHIHHPHAVGVLEVGEAGDRPFAVMPYVAGGTLADLLAGGPPSPGVVAAVMIDALRGLHAAHTAEDDRGLPLRLVHRDVCPENVLIGLDGRGRIADFGIAVAAAQTLDVGRGSGRGKWAFMSPEQLKNEPVDRRSDVFSAGVTLYHALTGRELFRGHSTTATMQNVLHMSVPTPSEVGTHPPAALDAVCLRALARDADQRFQSADAMADALRVAASSAGILASSGEVAAAVESAMGARLDARREALAGLEQGGPARTLPLPPPNPRDSAAEMLRPEEAARLAAELGEEDDDDDPDGPATSVYQPEDDGGLADLEIVIEGEGGSAAATAPDARKKVVAAGAHAPGGGSTMELEPGDLWAAGTGEESAKGASSMAAGTPPAGSAAARPEGGDEEETASKVSGWGRFWRRVWRALRPRAHERP